MKEKENWECTFEELIMKLKFRLVDIFMEYDIPTKEMLDITTMLMYLKKRFNDEQLKEMHYMEKYIECLETHKEA